jgi:hypothetical protein
VVARRTAGDHQPARNGPAIRHDALQRSAVTISDQTAMVEASRQLLRVRLSPEGERDCLSSILWLTPERTWMCDKW